MAKEEYEKMLREKGEAEAEYRMLILEEWAAAIQEFGLPEDGGVWEA